MRAALLAGRSPWWLIGSDQRLLSERGVPYYVLCTSICGLTSHPCKCAWCTCRKDLKAMSSKIGMGHWISGADRVFLCPAVERTKQPWVVQAYLKRTGIFMYDRTIYLSGLPWIDVLRAGTGSTYLC